MKKILALAGASMLFAACNQSAGVASKTALQTDKEKVAYAIGLDIGRSLKQTDSTIDLPVVFQGIKDQLDSGKKLLTDSAAQAVIQEWIMGLRKAEMEKRQKQADSNLTAQKTFLEGNKAKPGVIASASGMQFTVITEGTGASPAPTDTIVMHYEGWLLDGTQFDSSRKRGEPVTAPMDRLIPGFQEVLQKMKVGSKYKAWIPSEIGYGPAGSGNIPGNSLLTFEIELMGVKAGAPAAKTDVKPAKPIK